MSKPRSAARPSRTGRLGLGGADRRSPALLFVAGIAYVAYYLRRRGRRRDAGRIADLGDWNFLIGFGVMFLGLILAANPDPARSGPRGRHRDAQLFLVGLVWIVVYYMTSQNANIPVIRELGNYNLLVGIGFMAVGFVYATRWE